MARGQYVCFLDADDAVLQAALHRFADAIVQLGEIPLLLGSYVSVGKGNRQEKHLGSEMPTNKSATIRTLLTMKLAGLKHGSIVIHRRVFEELCDPEHIRKGTDIIFLGLVIARFAAREIWHPVLLSQTHPQCGCRNWDATADDTADAVDALFHPALMPSEMMSLRQLFASRGRLSRSRTLHQSSKHREAVAFYFRAIRHAPSLLLVNCLKRILLSSFVIDSHKHLRAMRKCLAPALGRSVT